MGRAPLGGLPGTAPGAAVQGSPADGPEGSAMRTAQRVFPNPSPTVRRRRPGPPGVGEDRPDGPPCSPTAGRDAKTGQLGQRKADMRERRGWETVGDRQATVSEVLRGGFMARHQTVSTVP